MLPALDQAMLEAMQAGYTPALVVSCALATWLGFGGKRPDLLRASLGIMAVALLRTLWEGAEGVLTPFQHLMLDVPLFIILTLPPRTIGQCVIGALAFGQVAVDVFWVLEIFPSFARWHWFLSTAMGLVSFAALIIWSIGGDGNAKRRVVRGWRWLTGLVLAKAYGIRA